MSTSMIKRTNGNSNLPSGSLSGWMDQLFNENLNRFFNDDLWGFRGIDRDFSVPMNLRETGKTYEMSLVAPGLRKEDFALNVNNDVLTVSYEHKEDQKKENSDEGWLRQEYRMRSFSRSFTLDDTVDGNKISASYDNGILHLVLPKKENAQRLTRKIEIK